MNDEQLHFFSKDEFGKSWDVMSPVLLTRLDVLRGLWGRAIRITPVEGGLARYDHSTSQHNVTEWGECRAVDIFPQGLTRLGSVQLFADLAQKCGFTGIGIYADTKPSVMFHLDVRTGIEFDKPMKWSRVDGQYSHSFDAALAEIGKQGVVA